MRDPERSVAAFDSALGSVRVLAAALDGHRLVRMGQGRLASAGIRLSAAMPTTARRRMYAWAGATEGVPPQEIGDVHLAAVAKYLTAQYPPRRYPGVLVGAANGGMT